MNFKPLDFTKTYEVYLERADDDKPKELIGTIKATNVSEALNKAAQYFEVPQYDLTVELIIAKTWGNIP